MKTFTVKMSDIKRKWYVIDASDLILGRLVSQVASILRGKNKPIFTPHLDTGDHVIIINADKIALTGEKWQDKKYYRHSGYIGGLRVTNAKKMQQKNPRFIIEHAVKGMLPKNPLGRMMFRKLKVYAGDNHPHQAQQPQLLELSETASARRSV